MPVLAAGGFEAPGVSDFWHPLVGNGAFALTRPMILMVFSTLVLGLVMVVGTRRLAVVPGKAQWGVETVYGVVRNGLGRDIIGEANFRRWMPLLLSLFTVILLNNFFGVLPFVQFPTMSRFAFPLVLALVVYVCYLGAGIKRRGLGGFLRNLVPPGLPGWIVPVVFVLELVTFFVTRPITLALRLFGNMFAGHIILLLFILGGEYMLFEGGALLKLVSVPTFILAFVLTVFELLIEFLQAYVFTLLAAVYLAEVYADEH